MRYSPHPRVSDRREGSQQGSVDAHLPAPPRAAILHLPGETVIVYQLYACDAAECVVAVAGYGDLGTGYMPLEPSFAEGGYEPADTFVSPRMPSCKPRSTPYTPHASNETNYSWNEDILLYFLR